MKDYCFLFPSSNPISSKILGLTLFPKILSTNQIAGLFYMHCLKKESSDLHFLKRR